MENKVSPAALTCLQSMAIMGSAARIEDKVYKKRYMEVGEIFHDAGVI